MAKKDYKTGIAGLLTPTAKPEGTVGTTGTIEDGRTEKTEGLYVSVPSSLKKQMDVFCAEHRIKKHVFITAAIRKYLG